jgi:hypothetical protein
LRGLLFCVVAGYHELCDFDMEREELGAEWVVVPNAPVERLLQLCDPNHGLPLAPSLEQAWKLFHHDKWPAQRSGDDIDTRVYRIGQRQVTVRP